MAEDQEAPKTLASPLDVETSLLRTLTETESQYVAALLLRAENLIKIRIPELLERAAEDPGFRAIVIVVEAEAVSRVFRNKDAIRQESEGNYSYTVNYEVASGFLDILDREWDRLGMGVGFGSILPATDGYLSGRFGGRPDLWFQGGWPAHNDFSHGGEFTL